MATLYTPFEIADLLKIKKSTVYELIKRGELISTKIGKQLRISEDAIKQYLAKDTITTLKDSQLPHNKLLSATDGLILCGQDAVLDYLCSLLEAHPSGVKTLRSFSGSYNSLYSLYFDKVHVASTHLWNAKTNTYNLSYIEHLLPGTPVECYHLMKRQQGFYVSHGNPKGIHNIFDLTIPAITFVNREKGSGTRILFDELLVSNKIESSKINGYATEVLSHVAGASYISSGKADVALGQEAVLRNFPSLDFIPLKEESYDLVFLKRNRELPCFKAMVEVIQSNEFKNLLEQQTYFDITDIGKQLI